MLLTRDTSGYRLWDVPKGVEPWREGPYWKFSCNEYYQYCTGLTLAQAGVLLNGKGLVCDKFTWVETSEQELRYLGIGLSFMSRNPWDHPARFPQFDRALAEKRMEKYDCWHWWFAWYPVRVKGRWVWLRPVKRRSSYNDNCVVCWFYR